MSAGDDEREHGIEFGDLSEALERLDYPADLSAVRREVGDHELELPDGTTTVSEALDGLQGETFESPEDVLATVKNMVGGEAVGRQGYSDRGDPEGDEGEPQESF